MNNLEVVMSYNFNFVARNRTVALRIMDELGDLPEVPPQVVSYIKTSIFGMVLPQEDTLIEIKAEGHLHWLVTRQVLVTARRLATASSASKRFQ